MKAFMKILDWITTAICTIVCIAGLVLSILVGISLSVAGGGVLVAIVIIVIIVGAIGAAFIGDKS